MDQLRWLHVTAVTLLLLLLLTLLVIASGYFEPHPLGDLVHEQTLQTLLIPSDSQQRQTLSRPLPSPPYSLQLTAALQSGEFDSAYGLQLGSADHQLGIAVSPLGTLAVWEKQTQPIFHLPWQTWPHVRLENRANEIWLDVTPMTVTVRINRELLWVGEVSELDGTLTLWGESWGETAVVEFQTLKLYAYP